MFLQILIGTYKNIFGKISRKPFIPPFFQIDGHVSTVTESADFGFNQLLRCPQDPQGCLEKQNCPLSLNLVVWRAKIGPKS